MKTPEEIKKGLAEAPHVKYVVDDQSRDDVHYERYGVAIGYILRDQIYTYITQLEASLAQVERERDAAVQIVHGLCLHCKNEDSKGIICRECVHYPYRYVYRTDEKYVDNWQWRGVCEENTKEEGNV